MTAGRNDEILTRWNLEKILTNRVRGIDSNPIIHLGSVEESYSTGERCYMGIQTLTPANDLNDYIVTCIDDFFSEYQ